MQSSEGRWNEDTPGVGDPMAASRPFDPAPADGTWLLLLDLVDADRLTAVLTDSRWFRLAAQAPWPPRAALALPRPIAEALAAAPCTALRLQLCAALDGWPWEAEAAGGRDRSCARHLTDLPEAPRRLPPVPLVVAAAANPAEHALRVAAARQQARPLVVAGPGLPAAQQQALERALRGHWRADRPLSQVLPAVLARLGLAAAGCRLYGDGCADAAEAEQGWRPVTALSIDLVSSTRLLRSLGAEAYAQRLRAYHDCCRRVIRRFQGSLDAPGGDDGLMAYFGFPLALEDAAARALSAAWALARGVEELGLEVRIGAASGQLAVTAEQAFGPEIHLAARLCAAAQPGQILVAASTRDRVGPRYVLDPCADGVTLKDFGSLKTVHALRGVLPAAADDGPPVGSVSGFVGRQRELDLLRGAWADACAGRPRWWAVRGEAGIGKSRLLQEFSRELRARGQRCLALAGQAQAVSSPYAAVVDALRHLWAIDAEVDARQVEARLAALLAPRRVDADDLADLAGLLVLSRTDELPASRRGRHRFSRLLLACLEEVVAPGPFCLLVDDAHWLDPSTTELLQRLHGTSSDRPLLVVIGTRGGADAVPALLPALESLNLQGLPEGDAQVLAAQLGSALRGPLLQRIVERAGGIPLYLEESLRMLSQRDSSADGDVPAKLEDLLMVRLDELGPDRTLAQLLSVLGRECSAVALDTLLEQTDPFVERARQQGSLGSLLQSGLLQPLDGPVAGYRFKHALIRDAAYASIWTDDRRRLHGLCADLIAQDQGGRWRQGPEQLANHLQAAGRAAEARKAWRAAAADAASRHAHREAVELARRALALPDPAAAAAERARGEMQLHLLIASAQIVLNGYGSAEVEAAYHAAEQAGREIGSTADAMRVRLGLEACYVMRGDLRKAGDLAREAVAATDWASDPRLAMQSRWALANVHFHRGDWREALAGFDACLANYRTGLHPRSGVQDPAILCLGYSSWILFELGRADEALARIARMLDLAATIRHPFSTGVAMAFAASIKRLCGDIDGAWPHAEEGVSLCERGGFQVWLAHAWMVRGQLRCDRGDVQGGADDLDRGYGLWVGGGARISCATYLATRAELLLRQGSTAQAVAALDEAGRISEAIGEHYYRAELLRLKGLGQWQAGDPDRAEATLRTALARATAEERLGLALRCALSLGALQAAGRRWDEPVPRLRALLDRLPRHAGARDTRWARQALRSWERGEAFAAAPSTPWEPM